MPDDLVQHRPGVVYGCPMAGTVRVMVETGKKKRSVASAYEWPGWDRWAKLTDDVVAVLERYRSRYAPVAELAGQGEAFAAAGPLEVVERLEGTGMTDFYGTSGRDPSADLEPLSVAEAERRVALLRACWETLDATAARVSAELRPGPRGGGRSRDLLVRHVNGAEIDEFAPKVGVKVSLDIRSDPAAMVAYRDAFAAAILEHAAQGLPARSWTLPFLIRRCAYHALDHAWEMEDRDLTTAG